MIETKKIPERAVLISVCSSNMTMERTEEYLSELAFLLDTAGGIPEKTFIQKVFRKLSLLNIGSLKNEHEYPPRSLLIL